MASEVNILPRLRRGTVEAFVLHAVGVGLLFLMHAYLGQAIGVRGYGNLSYALTLAGMLAVIVSLGWPTALMRFIAQYQEQQSWGLLRGVIRRAYQTTFLFAVLTSLSLWGISHWNSLSPELATSLHFAALILPFLAFVGLRRKVLRGFQRIKSSIIPEEVVLPLLVIAGMYLFAVSTASGALLVYAAAALVAFLLGNVLLLGGMPKQRRIARPEFKTRTWMATALPMVAGGLSQSIMNRIDVIMLGAMNNMVSVGLYNAATRIAVLNTFVLGAVNTIAAPMMAAAFHGGRHRQYRMILRYAMLFATVGALPLFAIMILWPQFLLGFFGPEFSQGGSLLRVLAIGQFVNAVTGPVGFALLMTGRERAFAWTLAAAATGNVIGNWALIQIWGAVGAAISTAVCIAVLNTWQWFLASKKDASLHRLERDE
jgi:O-antigen/teichoic acid export membrane protein